MFSPLEAAGSWEDDLADSPDILEELLVAGDALGPEEVAGASAPVPCECHGLPKGSCPVVVDRFIAVVVEVLAHPSGGANMDGARVELAGQIDPDRWETALGSYFDKRELVNALRFGWDFSLLPNPEPADAKENLPSAREFPEAVAKYVSTELSFGALVGPLPRSLPFAVFRSPLGTVPKPPSGRRVITDCSQRGRGINQWIPFDHHRGRYVKTTLPGTSQIVAAIRRTRYRYPGQIIKLFKADFARFYRQFLSCPSQSPFLCVVWEGETYCDTSWSFGNRGACHSAQRFSTAVAWVYRTQVPPGPDTANSGLACRCDRPCGCGDNEMSAYIDDSIGVCPADNAEWLFRSFIELVEGLTLRLSTTPGHISAPSTVCIALGVQYDTEANVISLPEAKLVDINRMLATWAAKKAASSRELASLSGRLLWACQVVPPGRLFLGRVLALKRQADARTGALARRPIALDSEFRLDLEWWSAMLGSWNGRSFLEPHHSAEITLDASSDGWPGGGPGIGCYNNITNEFVATGVPPELSAWPIADLELLAHLIALRAWDHGWYGHTISVLTDNESCRWLLQRGRSRDPRRLAMARILVARQFRGNFRLETGRISTTDNDLADSLSRLGQAGKWQGFLDRCSKWGVVPARIEVQPGWFSVAPEW